MPIETVAAPAPPTSIDEPPTELRLVASQSNQAEASPVPLESESLPAPRPDEPLNLTLDQAINACLLGDPKLRAGFEAINQAGGDALTASLKPNPELFTDVQLLPLTRPFTVDKQGGPPQQDVNVSYPIDWFLFGKRAAAMTAATRGVRMSQAEYENLVRLRVRETALAYYDFAEAAALVDVMRQNVENLLRIEALTEKAVEAGGRPHVELHRVRLDLLQIRQAQRDAELALVTSQAQLRALLGGMYQGVEFLPAELPTAPAPAEPPPVETAYALAWETRPDVLALRWKISRSDAEVELERRRAYPEVAPQFGYTRQYQQKAIGFPDADSWSAALTMSVPLHDRNQGNRVKAASVAAQSRWELRSAELELRAEIETAVESLRIARANADAVAQEQLALAAQVRDSINEAYEAGGRPLIDVLDAQRNYRETYRLFISSRAEYWRALYRLNSAVGEQVVPP